MSNEQTKKKLLRGFMITTNLLERMDLILTAPGDAIYTTSLNMVDTLEGLGNYLLPLPGEREHPNTFFWPTLGQLVRLCNFAGKKCAEEEKNE